MSDLAITYAALGRHAEALKLNEEGLRLCKAKLREHHPVTAMTVYNMARIHASFIPKSTDGGKQADLAMDWLKRAIAAGFEGIGAMNVISADKELAPLRDRVDFKKLLAELGASLTKNAKETDAAVKPGSKP